MQGKLDNVDSLPNSYYSFENPLGIMIRINGNNGDNGKGNYIRSQVH